ncbi:MAG: MATE family efflux transporter [Porticoccaceae bacterium]|nr:MATE family efflux transporter [Porticoccaceae bacterium]
MLTRSTTHRQFLSIALPMVLAALASPLPGIVDTAMLGHLGSVDYLSAVAAGSTIIGLLIWSFSFLRMGTTATTARALGSNDQAHCQLLLAQSLILAAVLGMAIVVFQKPLFWLGFMLVTPPEQSLALAETYTAIRIFAAPAILGSFCITGWLIGIQKAKAALALMLLVNGLNVGLDFFFIIHLDMNSEGAAWASLIAEYAGLLVGLTIVSRLALATGFRTELGLVNTGKHHMHKDHLITELRQLSKYRELFIVNRHLLVRTTCLIFVFAFFTAQGAKQTAAILAANAILMQLFFLFAFGLDGFAHAAEALSGQAIGERNEALFYKTCELAAGWGFVVASLTTSLYLGFDSTIIGFFTNIETVSAIAGEYFIWLAMVPLTAVISFVLDGIFLGAGKTRSMQNIMLVCALTVFLPTWYLTRDLGNDGLWLAFLLFMAARTILMATTFWRVSQLGGWLIEVPAP